MSTDIQTTDPKPVDETAAQFLALRPDSGIAETMAANCDGEQISIGDLIRIPTPSGGSTMWVIDGVSGQETAKEVEGLLVGYQPRGTLWPTSEPSDSRPILVSNDLLTAHLAVDPDEADFGDIDRDELFELRRDDGTWDWPSLPWNAWGSGRGKGKRCKESRMLFILRPGDTWPVLIQCPPASLKLVRKFVSFRLPLPHWRCVVAIGLEKKVNDDGQPYASWMPRLTGTIGDDEGKLVKQLYTDPLHEVCKRVQRFDSTLDA